MLFIRLVASSVRSWVVHSYFSIYHPLRLANVHRGGAIAYAATISEGNEGDILRIGGGIVVRDLSNGKRGSNEVISTTL